MKDKIGDIVYSWKHGLSSQNAKGNRGFLWGVFLVCVALVLSGLVGVVVSIITHKILPLVLGLVLMAWGIAAFAWVGSR